MSQLDTNTTTLNNILTKINNLPEKQNLSVVTATASDVLKPKVIVGADGQPITGTIEDLSDQMISGILQGSTHIDNVFKFTLPNGYTTNNSKLEVSDYEMGLFSGITADQIAEGETVLGITGTHSGGLKVVTGTTSNWWKYDSTRYCISINAGIKAKYVILNIGTSFDDSYQMPASLDQAYSFDNTYVPCINFSRYYASDLYPYYLILTTGYTSEIPVSNTESNIQFYFCASSATINFQDISWVVIGE